MSELTERAHHIVENGGLLAKDTALKLIEQLEAAHQRIAELEKMYENRTPTQWAYDQACAALHRKTEELARRDAGSGDPDGYIFLHPNGKLFWSVTADSNAGQKDIKPFYFSGHPSALPPEVTELTDYQKDNIRFMSKIEAAIQGANWMRERAKALGCKPIKLPPLSKSEKNFYGVLGDGYEAWLGARTVHAVWNEAIKRCTSSLKEQGFSVED